MYFLRNFICTLYIFSIVGCSALGSGTQTLSINSNQPNTKVIVNGNVYRAPIQVEVSTRKKVNIQAIRSGYYPFNQSIDSTISTTGVLDIVGGFFFFFPFLGLLSDGAWQLDQDIVNINLIRNN